MNFLGAAAVGWGNLRTAETLGTMWCHPGYPMKAEVLRVLPRGTGVCRMTRASVLCGGRGNGVCGGVCGCKGVQTVSSSQNKTTMAINAKLKALTALYSNFHMAISLPS